MCPDLEQLGKLIPKETVGKVYDDLLAPSAKEIGKLGGDVAKTARLILAPLQATAALQDRFAAMVQRIRERVPDNKQIEPPAEVVGPALEHMRYLDESSALWSMYEEVLTRAVDRDQNATVHPSFAHIICQLSRDEAWILYRLRSRSFAVVDEFQLNRKENRFFDRVVIESELPIGELYRPDVVDLSYSHLESLALATWPVERQDPVRNAQGEQTGVRRHSKMMLTDFGRLFASACIPEHGFEQHAKK
jgi:hypothetical protein